MEHLTDVVWPDDAYALNVMDYGAVGDGATNDTQALRDAISAAQPAPTSSVDTGHFVYIPKDTAIAVNDEIAWRLNQGSYGCFIGIQGENKATSKIKLLANSTGYNNTGSPKAVLKTASINNAQFNTAFNNFVRNLTIEIDSGNAGALALDMNVSNVAGASDLRIIAAEGSGRTGLTLTRAWPGPAWFDNIEIDGFDYGIDLGSFQYGCAFEHILVKNQRIAGVRDSQNLFVCRDLKSRQVGDVPAILITDVAGVISLVEADLYITGSSGGAIDNSIGAHLYLRDVRNRGYAYKLKSKTPGVAESVHNYTNEELGNKDEFTTTAVSKLHEGQRAASLRLPIEEPPRYYDTDMDNWANVQDFGAVIGDNTADNAAAIQDAFDSGASTIYFPAAPGGQTTTNSNYYVRNSITIPGTVKQIVFFQSLLRASTWAGTDFFTTLDETDDLLVIRNAYNRQSVSPLYSVSNYTGVSVTNGSAVVTGSGTSWNSGIVGRAVEDVTADANRYIPFDTYIQSVESATSMTLTRNATGTGTRNIRTGDNFNPSGAIGSHYWLNHQARRPLLVRDSQWNYMRFAEGCGKVNLVGCHIGFHMEKGTRVWARGHNMENVQGQRITNDGGQLWFLGLKVERYGTIVKTYNGGKTEVIGGFNIPTTVNYQGEPALRTSTAITRSTSPGMPSSSTRRSLNRRSKRRRTAPLSPLRIQQHRSG
jgi:hypothetical protein